LKVDGPDYPRAKDSPATFLGLGSFDSDGLHKYWHYLFVVSLLAILVSVLALLNAYLKLNTATSYSASQAGLPTSSLLAGYVAMFGAILILPIPDYILIPVYGYLSATGIFNPFVTFLVCLAGAITPLEYVCGWFAARPLVLKGLSYFRITRRDLEVAEKWLANHGRFAIFISTFIPFFYTVAALAAGTLRMKPVPFLFYTTSGFAVRYAFLEYVGYVSVYIFAASFDYSQRGLFTSILVLSCAYAAVHIERTLRQMRTASVPAGPVSTAKKYKGGNSGGH